MKKRTVLLMSVTLCCIALMGGSLAFGQRTAPLIADHTRTDLITVPATCIDQAKAAFKVSYGHTSHGSQIITGMALLMNRDPLYSYNHDGTGGALSLWDTTPGGDLGNPDYVTWARLTRDMLNTPGCDRNLVVWSWCGEASWATESDIADSYLGNMDQLERDFPNVTFVYMTSHLDGTGVDGNLNVRNNQIRDFVRANNKVLFDFTDIESYDPDGNYYVDRAGTDNCDYDNGAGTGNWAVEWCAAHPAECESCGCAHSQCLNCQRKGRAFWWLLANLVCPTVTPCQTTVTGLQAVNSAGDVSIQWNTVADASSGYNLWYVTSETEIANARLGGSPLAVSSCANPVAGLACADIGGVGREPTVPYFYQVRASCGSTEGP